MTSGIAAACACCAGGAACAACAGKWLPGAASYTAGRHMGLIHGGHVPALTAAGWTVTDYPHEPPDVVCPHYAAMCAGGSP